MTDDASPRGQVALALWEPPFAVHGRRERRPGAPVGGGRGRRPAHRPRRRGRADAGVRALAARRGDGRPGRPAAAGRGRARAGRPGGGLPRRLPARGAARARAGARAAAGCSGCRATNALELGIDIAGLDAVLLAGFPGTRASLWQQVGRAGRGAGDALGVLVARDDPLDTYLVTTPRRCSDARSRRRCSTRTTPTCSAPHLCAAAAELPLTRRRLAVFGAEAPRRGRRPGRRGPAPPATRRAGSGPTAERASDLADIRSAGRPRRCGWSRRSPDGCSAPSTPASAHGTVHTGAVYVHQGETYLVDELDLDERVAVVEPRRPGLLDVGPRGHRHRDRRASTRHQTWGDAPGQLRRRST